MIKKQGSTYHFRRKIPLHLQPVLGKKETWMSLRTSRPTTARARAGRIYALTEELFDPETCTDLDRWKLETAKLAAEVANLELEKLKRKTELDETRRLMHEAAEVKTQGELIEAANEKLQAFDGKLRAVRDGVLTKGAALEEARRAHDAMFAALAGAASGMVAEPAPEPSPRFSTLIEEFIAEKQSPSEGHKGYSEQTTSQTRSTFGLWLSLIGDGPVREFKGRDAGQFRKLLLRLPASHGKSRSDNIEPIDAIERADRAEHTVKRLSMRTVKRHFSTMSQYWKWLGLQEYVDKNIFSGFSFPGTKSKKKNRDDWSKADLKLFFESDWYTSRSPDSAVHWLPLIALYSGMRLEEIARLRPAQDIEEVAGIWCFRLQEHKEPEPWSPKTEAGERNVPIHSKLIELGLLELVEKRQELPYLWPDLTPSGRERKRGNKFSREFSRRKIAMGVGEKTVFHSFRHTGITILESTDLLERWIDAVFGHENDKRSTGGKVYAKRVEVERLQEVVEAIKIDIGV